MGGVAHRLQEADRVPLCVDDLGDAAGRAGLCGEPLGQGGELGRVGHGQQQHSRDLPVAMDPLALAEISGGDVAAGELPPVDGAGEAKGALKHDDAGWARRRRRPQRPEAANTDETADHESDETTGLRHGRSSAQLQARREKAKTTGRKGGAAPVIFHRHRPTKGGGRSGQRRCASSKAGLVEPVKRAGLGLGDARTGGRHHRRAKLAGAPSQKRASHQKRPAAIFTAGC